ncbi:very short patch repair endonuclease [Streptomyces sp. NPDC051677]|uniref:very short patch repair endonuclease n=1 Tax=Streptomyces sp. NPDC051677 TaxID=3365669 RepID=UPI0037CDE05D
MDGDESEAVEKGTMAERGSWASSDAVRASMQANKSRDTKPELALRRAVHARGLRYRVAARPIKELRRTADLVFTKARVAVFLDGCFWHGCPEHHTVAVRNGGYWASKVERNRTRDVDTDQRLAEAGWAVVRVWEHEDPVQAAARVEQAVAEARRAHPRRTTIAPGAPNAPNAPGGSETD